MAVPSTWLPPKAWRWTRWASNSCVMSRREAVYITEKGQLFTRQCADNPVSNPCLFEYVYFARPDSFIDKISVYSARVNMGTKLGEKIAREWDDLDIDVVIPIPETSCDIALEIARILDKPYRQGFVKNRYVGRTFIMPGQQLRRKSVRRKLNANRAEFRDKNVLLVDDSIVRGTTSEQIIEMAREAGAKKVYLASAAPEIRFPNVYGIDMPTANELIAHGREVDEIRQIIGADGLIFGSERSDRRGARREPGYSAVRMLGIQWDLRDKRRRPAVSRLP